MTVQTLEDQRPEQRNSRLKEETFPILKDSLHVPRDEFTLDLNGQTVLVTGLPGQLHPGGRGRRVRVYKVPRGLPQGVSEH